jgi:flagellar basal body-associated protein FliL
MTEPMGTPLGEPTGQKKSRTWLIVLIVVLVVCCLCVVVVGGGYWLWNNGDRILGLASALRSALA